MIFRHLARRFLSKISVHNSQNITGYPVDEYAKVLNREELEKYFCKNELQNQALPSGIENLKKQNKKNLF